MIMGTIITLTYLSRVPSTSPLSIDFLFLGVFLESFGMVIVLWPAVTGKSNVNIKLFLLCLLILSASIAYMNTARFSLPTGSDTQTEFKTAYIVSYLGHWDPSSIWISRYMGTLSVTIYPLIVTTIMGITTLDVFRIIFPMLLTTLPLLGFIAMRKYLGDSPLTYLSAALLPQIFFFPYLQNMDRSIVALIAFLSILIIFNRNDKGSVIIASLLSFALISSHYTVAYFALVVFLSLLLLPRLFAKLLRQQINSRFLSAKFLVVYVIVLFFWITFVFLGMTTDIWSLYLSFSSLIQGQTHFLAEVTYTLSSPRGPILTAWFDIEFLLIGIGGILALLSVLRNKVSSSLAKAWMLAGGLLVLFVVTISLIPNLGSTIDPDRLISYSLPFFASFIALSLLSLPKKRFTVPIILCFLLLMLPMNLLLPNYSADIRYLPERSLSPQRQLVYRTTFALAETGRTATQWMDSHTPLGNYLVATDLVGGLTISTYMLNTSFTLNPTGGQFLLLSYLYLDYGLWGTTYWRGVTQLPIQEPSTMLCDSNLDFVYSNRDYSVAIRV